MGNVVILSEAEIAIRNERRRQVEQGYTASVDAERTQEAMRAQVRKQVNKMVSFDEALLARRGVPQDVDVLEDYRLTWTKIGALAVASIEAIDTARIIKIGGGDGETS